MSFCYTRTGSYHHILDRLSYTMWIVKRNTDDDDDDTEYTSYYQVH
jgi:hypothetical protein